MGAYCTPTTAEPPGSTVIPAEAGGSTENSAPSGPALSSRDTTQRVASSFTTSTCRTSDPPTGTPKKVSRDGTTVS